MKPPDPGITAERMEPVACIGGGVIGGGWAARFLLMGRDVRLFDPDRSAQARAREVLARARHALPMLYDVSLPPEGHLTICGSIDEAVSGSGWIQESVPERLEVKHQVFAEVQAAASRDVIIASSTSGFTPTELQSGSTRPGQIIVAHPFNPVYLLPLVEVVASAANPAPVLEAARDRLKAVGMFPLQVHHEIPAHLADRLLEAVWREGLWLVRDGIATTQEVDDAIRFGFGLRWAQMGLFETYRIAGGADGMRHFLHQFGPALQWPWSRLTDVPALDDALIERIAAQSDRQAAGESIAQLEARRDANLVVLIRALRQQDSAAGALLNAHQRLMSPPPRPIDELPLVTVQRSVPIDWTDYNGHMNEGRYGQVFSDAADCMMRLVGADEAYIRSGFSWFTVETAIQYLQECRAGEAITVQTLVQEGQGKKLCLFHRMFRDDDQVATCSQLMLHVSLETRRSCLPPKAMGSCMATLENAHAPELARSGISIPARRPMRGGEA